MWLAFTLSKATEKQGEDFAVAAMADLLGAPTSGMSGWYAQAAQARTAGLYVDIDGPTWRTPRAVTEDDFRTARAAVVPLVRSVTAVVRAEEWERDTPTVGPT